MIQSKAVINALDDQPVGGKAVLSRRMFVQGAAAASAVVSVAGCQSASSEASLFAKESTPIGIQLYMLGDLVQKDLDSALGQVASIGYKTVEIPNFMGKSPAEVRAALDRAGLVCTSAHVGLFGGSPQLPDLTGDLSKLADQVSTVGAHYVVAPIFSPPPGMSIVPQPGEGLAQMLRRIAAAMTEEQWKRLAAQLNKVGAGLKTRGLKFAYHNHNVEFGQVGAGTGFDVLLAETDPDLVLFELDVGWVSAAGFDPVELLQRHRDRYRLMHVKDLKASTPPNFALQMQPTEVGSGRLDWSRLLPEAFKAGVTEFFVEQEPPFERDRFEAARINFAYLSSVAA